MVSEQPIDIEALYRELFGRAPDQQGYDYWRTQAPSLMAQGGTHKMREAMIGGAAQPDAQYYANRNTSEADWNAYTNRAQQQLAGLNNMPGVFSDYASLASATPEQANALMYHDQNSLKSILENFGALYGVKDVEQLAGVGGGEKKNTRSGILPKS